MKVYEGKIADDYRNKFVQSFLKGGVCFVAGTLVLTETGQEPIETITEGEYVYATDPETGESGYKQVVQTYVNETNELLESPITVYNFGKELFNIW